MAHDLERLTERLRAVPGRLLAHPESVIMQRPRIGVAITLRRVGRFEALRVAKAQRYPSSPMTSGDARAAQALPGSAFAARASAALA